MRVRRWKLSAVALVAATGWGCKGTHHPGRDAADAQAVETAPAKRASQRIETQSFAGGCPEFAPAKKLGRVREKRLTEASGLAVSRRNPRVLWSHNDAGGKPNLFALDQSGRELGSYRVKHAELVDWEDVCVGPSPDSGDWYLYVGDVGANEQNRDDVVVYRLREPSVKLDQKPKKRKIKGVVRYRYRYPDGISRDVETLMVDPQTGHLYLATKTSGIQSELYLARVPTDDSQVTTLERVANLRLVVDGSTAPALITGGDIAPDGSAILVRTITAAYLWPRRSGETVAAALGRAPCRIRLENEPQGEAIAFSPAGDGFYTLSEGSHPGIHFYARKR